MKTLLVTTLGAFVITLVFVAGGYTLYRIEVNFTVSVVMLVLPGWFRSGYYIQQFSAKRKKGSFPGGSINAGQSFELLFISFHVSFITYHRTQTIITSMTALPPTLIIVFMY